MFNSYPDLLQEFELEDLLWGDVEMPDAHAYDIKMAGLLSCLQLMLHFCIEIEEEPNIDDERFDALKYVLNSIDCGKFVYEMLGMIITVVGADYYKTFQKKINAPDFDLEQAAFLQNDPELQEHIDLILWFCLVRVFLESVYVYFEIDNP